MKELHKKGGTKEDVISALQVLPVVRLSASQMADGCSECRDLSQHPAMKRGVRNLKARKDVDTTFLCLSNSNCVYINTILEVRTCALSGLSARLMRVLDSITA